MFFSIDILVTYSISLQFLIAISSTVVSLSLYAGKRDPVRKGWDWAILLSTKATCAQNSAHPFDFSLTSNNECRTWFDSLPIKSFHLKIIIWNHQIKLGKRFLFQIKSWFWSQHWIFLFVKILLCEFGPFFPIKISLA